MEKMEIELSMEVDDSLRVIESFQPDDDYKDFLGNPEHFNGYNRYRDTLYFFKDFFRNDYLKVNDAR